MKSVKGKLMKKLKSIKPVGYLKPDRVLQAFAIDGFIDSYTKTPNPHENEQPKLFSNESEQEMIKDGRTVTVEEQPEVIDVEELMKDLDDEEEEDKENIRPTMKENSSNLVVVEREEEEENVMNRRQSAPLTEIDVSSFRKPDLNSCTLFDPNLLAAFEQAVKEHLKMSEEERRARIEKENKARIEEDNLEPPHKTRRIDDDVVVDEEEEEKEEEEEEDDPLSEFEEKCPPGGESTVILYTTTLKGIRKTFEDCNGVRFLLESCKVGFYERDISMHSEYREELWRVLGGKVMPPRLFIKGRYIGGAEEILGLNERGKFKLLFHGIPLDTANTPCEGCGGVRFVLCFNCNGSHRVIANDGLSNPCLNCNENGLIICPYCC